MTDVERDSRGFVRTALPGPGCQRGLGRRDEPFGCAPGPSSLGALSRSLQSILVGGLLVTPAFGIGGRLLDLIQGEARRAA